MDWIVPVANAVAAGVLPFVIVEEMEHKEFCAVESACLDFKRDGYHDDAESLANAVKDIASLYNTYGGFIVFGVDEVEKDVRYKVVGIDGTPFNMQQLRGKVDAWLTNKIDFSYDEVKLKCGPTIGVVFVHKRPASERPNQFKRRGPEIKPGRYAFDAGNVAMRRGDKSVLASEMADWQLILGDRKPDILAKEIGRLVQTTRSGAALDHNLPSRAMICAKFVGRVDVLTKLWAWLNDEFQYAQLIAGEGGKGKTSVAYEFATQVAYQAPHGIQRIIWLTAKKEQFSGIENTWRAMPHTDFDNFRSMLAAVGRNLGYTDDELANATEPELRRMVRSEIGIQPTLFVLDDIDSLVPDDQRRALEFAQQAGSYDVRFLLTTRSNASYSSSIAVTLGGLAGQDYADLVAVLEERYSVNLPKGGVHQLEAASGGSPLLTESMLRVVRTGTTLGKAISEWRGHSGEDARNAILGREVAQLSREAQRVLLCLAFLGQCSKAELMSASNLLDIRLGDALEELQSLFIVNAHKIIASEPRFELSVTTALLVISKRTELAADHNAIEKRIKATRTNVRGEMHKRNSGVAIAISQALALTKSGNRVAAIATIDAALRAQKNHPDLLSFKGRLMYEADAPDYESARKLFRQAFHGGARKHVLFDLWYRCERSLGFGHGVIEISEVALKEFPSEQAIWIGRRADGYVLNGLVRYKNGEFDSAISELSQAAVELESAIELCANKADRGNLSEMMFGVHDTILRIFPLASLAAADRVSAIREMTSRGDARGEILNALGGSLLQSALEFNARASRSSAQRERLESNQMYVLDLLRQNGYEASSLYGKVSMVHFRGP